jgi:hypothetical protein
MRRIPGIESCGIDFTAFNDIKYVMEDDNWVA